MNKFCWGCEHFKIVKWPTEDDIGKAKCEKHGIAKIFIDVTELGPLGCVENESRVQ